MVDVFSRSELLSVSLPSHVNLCESLRAASPDPSDGFNRLKSSVM